ncbi:MAG: hypothetical protein O3A01_09055 [bacterium]|nr:hypothetical protein [bacterium]
MGGQKTDDTSKILIRSLATEIKTLLLSNQIEVARKHVSIDPAKSPVPEAETENRLCNVFMDAEGRVNIELSNIPHA